jgi:hypothetical protein
MGSDEIMSWQGYIWPGDIILCVGLFVIAGVLWWGLRRIARGCSRGA